MIQIKTVVKNATGLHARPAARLVKLCKTYKSKVTLQAGGRCCDAKSIFKLLQCAIKVGEIVIVQAEGEDEAQAATAVAQLIDALEE
ncbi:HPr family phosphocarrier protein [Oscillospiraceae bacterium MB08-C2-2]|nr:HPr family phosphocarrier protein [Oscillospiraceae bacterium MB08-C2-2]